MDLMTRRGLHLVEPDWLEPNLNTPGIRVVDMRGYVHTETHENGFQTVRYVDAREEYEASHIPGAVYLDWTRDIVDLEDPVPAQVARAEQIARVFGEAGIDSETLVVAYDSHPAHQFATRLWWVLKYYGHDSVRVLNGGWPRWLAEGRPVSSEPAQPERKVFVPRVRPGLRVTAEQALDASRSGEAVLVDARDPEQFSGRVRRGPRGGHIPGAINLPRENLVAEGRGFLPSEELQARVQALGIPEDRPVIAYCNGGVAATSALFALSMLGQENLANYDGSWNEWTARPDLPVERSDS